jgi:hypothetical protein
MIFPSHCQTRPTEGVNHNTPHVTSHQRSVSTSQRTTSQLALCYFLGSKSPFLCHLCLTNYSHWTTPTTSNDFNAAYCATRPCFQSSIEFLPRCRILCDVQGHDKDDIAQGVVREGKWRGNRRMEWVPTTPSTTAEIASPAQYTRYEVSRIPRLPVADFWFLRVCPLIVTAVHQICPLGLA